MPDDGEPFRLPPLPPLRDVIREHGLSARKALGQNYLLDLNLTGKIARAAGDLAGRTVLEIGPGPGGLTRALLEAGARVIAIERDRRFVKALAPLAAVADGRLIVVEADALAIHPVDLIGSGPAQVVANLPYNAGTPLLVGWLEAEPWPPWWQRLTLMFQKEVAERLVAPVGASAYGRLAVLAQWRATVSKLFEIPPTAFVPPPKVWSAVVRFDPRERPAACSRILLGEVTAAAFGQRRKMLRSSLKALAVETAHLLDLAGLDPTQRAETVPVEGFVRLANALADLRGA